MKQIKYYVLAGLAMMMLLIGCTEDNSMTEIQKENESATGQDTPTDEVVKALSAIPGVYDVQLVTNNNSTGNDGDNNNDDDDDDDDDDENGVAQSRAAQETAPYYSFYFEQPIDHYNLQLGTYRQYCLLKYKGMENNVVVYTNGYNLEKRDVDLAQQLNANQLNIEHRYFGNSLPEPFENVSLTYLNADQAAHDIHNVVSALKTHLFKTGKWVSTGTSKDGITTALQAYYSDINGWKDIDVYVPFCAPFMTGTNYDDGSHSCNDISTGTYLRDVCGNGYPAGSREAIAYERLRKIPVLICTNKKIRDMVIRAWFEASPQEYAKIVEQFNNKSQLSTGDLTKDLAAYSIRAYYESLFDKFSAIPYAIWSWLVPDLTPLENDTATTDQWGFFMKFITMDEKQLAMYIRQFTNDTKSNGTTRSVSEELWNFLQLRRLFPSTPYQVQAFKELGTNDYDYSIVNSTKYLTETECVRVNYQFTGQYIWSQAAAEGIYKQDGGKLMTEFRKWAETESKYPIIFVYAYNDPWTGAGISNETAQKNPMIEKVVDGIAVHDDQILHRDYYLLESEQKIVSALNKFLK